jgi:hypothetical protein
MNATIRPRDGDYVMNFPHEREGDRTTARDVMRRNGCRSIRFELHANGMLIAHGYIARLDGPGVEGL